MQVLKQFRAVGDPAPVVVWYEAGGSLEFVCAAGAEPDRIVGQGQLLDRNGRSWSDQFALMDSLDPFAQLWELAEVDSALEALRPPAAA